MGSKTPRGAAFCVGDGTLMYPTKRFKEVGDKDYTCKLSDIRG